MQVNNPAVDRKLRRKANRQQRRAAAIPLDLSTMQKRAEHDVRLRCNLSEAAMAGVPGAAKAKRKLNDVWTNRNSRNLTGFWNPKA